MFAVVSQNIDVVLTATLMYLLETDNYVLWHIFTRMFQTETTPKYVWMLSAGTLSQAT